MSARHDNTVFIAFIQCRRCYHGKKHAKGYVTPLQVLQMRMYQHYDTLARVCIIAHMFGLYKCKYANYCLTTGLWRAMIQPQTGSSFPLYFAIRVVLKSVRGAAPPCNPGLCDSRPTRRLLGAFFVPYPPRSSTRRGHVEGRVVHMIMQLKRLLVGKPLDNEAQQHQRLSKRIALAVFSSDALSSVAYASEAILGVLLLAGAASLSLIVPISIGIVGLLATVGFSYRQTIHAYPNGGGAYIVARENLGKTPGLIAAASLLIDYVLTVAVSVSAGVAALAALATTWGFHDLERYSVDVALVLIALVTLINLRGVKESGVIFAVPTYMFVVSMFAMIGIGLARMALGGAQPLVSTELPPAVENIGLFLLLRAFSAGCTAMTGVEAISNGVPAFRKPESHNASTTLIWMISLLSAMFLGISFLANYYRIAPREGVTVISQIANIIVGTGPAFLFIQVATALILVLAANTAFADFPRLANLLSNDRFLPRQFSQRGDRLVFSNGIVVLGVFAALLVVFFQAREQAMLPLYAIGVFISFTLSQVGMVIHHQRVKDPGWQRGAVVNGLGGALTALVLFVLIITRFTEGAWAVVVLIPIMVIVLRSIHRHYADVARQLSLADAPPPTAVRRHTAVVLISGVHKGVIPALQYGLSLAPDNVQAVYVDLDSEATAKLQTKWDHWGCGVPLVIVPSPYRSLLRPLLQYIDEIDRLYEDDVLTIIMPEFIPLRWWEHLLHNQTALLIRTALLFRRGRVVISVPYRLEK